MKITSKHIISGITINKIFMSDILFPGNIGAKSLVPELIIT